MIDHELRRLAIGGSEIGAIFGCDERRDQHALWAAKRGGLLPAAATPEMVLGKCLEKGIVIWWEHVTGHAAEWCDETTQHPTRPYMVYSPDALVPDKRIGVDAKYVHWSQRKHWGEDAEEVPRRIILQCYWYLAALDYESWDVCALMGDGAPRTYTIHRDLEAERVMLERVEEWWRRYIVGDEVPEIGHADDSAEWLRQAFPRNRADVRPATAEEMAWLSEYTDLRIAEKIMSPRREELENKIKAAIGDRDGLVWPDGKFTWKATKDTVKTDWESMAHALLTFYVKDETERRQMYAQYAALKPGSRRIYFDAVQYREATA